MRFDLPIAGPASRMLAYAIDLIVIILLASIVMVVLVRVSSLFVSLVGQFADTVTGADPQRDKEAIEQFLMIGVLVAVWIQLVCEVAYFTFWELTARGQSPGKRAMGLRVIGEGGTPLTWTQSLARNLLRIVDILPSNYVVGLIAMLNNRDSKRLGDIVAGTVVIRLDRPLPALPVLDAALPGDEAFIFAADQLQRIGATEARLVRQTLRRLEAVTPQDSAAVLQSTVEALVTRLRYPPVESSQRAAFLRALHRALTVHH